MFDRTEELKSGYRRGRKGLFPFVYRRIYDWQNPKSFSLKKRTHGLTPQEQSSFEAFSILLDNVARLLLLSPTFKALIDTTPELENVYMTLSNKETTAEYQLSLVTVGVYLLEEFGMNPEGLIYAVAHEYRHAWQDVNGVTQRQMSLSAKDSVIINKAVEADAVAFMITICHELNQIGVGGALEALLQSQYYGATEAFLNSVSNNDQSVNSGSAQRKAFMAYLSNRSFETGYGLDACKNFRDYRKQDGLHFKFRPVASLVGVDKALSEMPYYDEGGVLCQRDAYNIKPKTPHEIDLLNRMPSSQVERMLRHLDRHPPPRPMR